MQRSVTTYTVPDSATFRQKLLQWAQAHREVVFLESNRYPSRFVEWEAVLAVDALTQICTDGTGAFDALSEYRHTTSDWLFGYLSYDLKNDTEALVSENPDGLGFPDLFFFQPKKLFFLSGNTVALHYLPLCDDEMDDDFQHILATEVVDVPPPSLPAITQRVPREAYLSKIEGLQEHIHRGDIYEVNFCMEFYAEGATLDPPSVYQRLNAVSAPPFAAFLKRHRDFLMSASPERYLAKKGTRVFSQPIKGTAPRGGDALTDKRNRTALSESAKDRAENIMIVDLVRNDLSRTATRGSVEVEELCGIHTFPQVHQMISTVVSELTPDTDPVDVLRTTFPMGSMTGAPKISAMQLIELFEESKRGLYSGALGYFTPTGDFDFSVVIRSILYQAERKYVSFSAGSAITALSDPEAEYEECLLKSAAMKRVLMTQ